jgi:predicted CoA-binding protein
VTYAEPSRDAIYQLLDQARTIAMVGASSNPERESHLIFKRLLSVGYHVIPVNPNETEVLGQKSYATLEEIPERVDIVDVFRKSEETPAIAESAVKTGAKTLWLQQGVANAEAARIATEGGLTIVMDKCLATAHTLLGVPKRSRTS